ncbi:MAG: hypothetical protein H6Q64_856 [Firmicutes bacterium]|nr:hypothetical protein [Bacillota bacterium]
MTDKQFNAGMMDIVKLMNDCKYKAIILYLISDEGQPEPDLIKLLTEFAATGYLCFICQPSALGSIELIDENMILINHGLSLVPIMSSLSAVVLTTRNIHSDWKEIMPHKLIWFHAEASSAGQADEIYSQADLISYFQSVPADIEKYHSDNRGVQLGTGLHNKINVNLLEKKICSLPRGWLLYANLDLLNKVAVMTATFLDFKGEFFYSGGAERYLLDLADVCTQLHREMVVFQYGDYPWMRHFGNINIVSLSRRGVTADGWILKCARDFNRIFYELVQGRTALNIYSAFFEAWPAAALPNIGISHGVSWDNPYNDFENAVEFWVMNGRYIEGARACEELISVDTNTANWLQTVDFALGQKTKLIANYVNLNAFKPRENYLLHRYKTVILYPRQLYSARGLYLVLEIMDEILEKYPETEFHFVGRGGEEDIAQVLDKQVKWGKRVKYCPLGMDEMPQAYQAADIALIPSMHSEGTSLSCLEAMACGNAVIATRIGGLSDLIINDYNGSLIDPRPEDLKQAIVNLLENSGQMKLYKARSCEVAQAFSREKWQKHWLSVLENKMEETQFYNNDRSRVIEIKLEKCPDDFRKLGKCITSLLAGGDLVYIRSDRDPDPALSFARLQWLAPDAPLFAACDLTIEWQG